MPKENQWPCFAGTNHGTPDSEKRFCRNFAMRGADACLEHLASHSLVACVVRCCSSNAVGLFCEEHTKEIYAVYTDGLGNFETEKRRVISWLQTRANPHAAQVAGLEEPYEGFGKRGAVELVGVAFLLAASVLFWLAFLSGLVLAVGKVDLLSGLGGFAIFCACLGAVVIWVGSRRFTRRSGWVEGALSVSLLLCLVGAVLSCAAMIGGNEGGFIAGPLFCLGVAGFYAAPFFEVTK